MGNKKSLILIGVFSLIFFLIGFSFDPKCEEKIITKEIIKKVDIANEDYNSLKTDIQKLRTEDKIRTQIMAIDNKIIFDSAEGSELCSQSIEAILNNDLNKLENATAQVIVLIDDIDKLGEQKAKLLLQLEK